MPEQKNDGNAEEDSQEWLSYKSHRTHLPKRSAQ